MALRLTLLKDDLVHKVLTIAVAYLANIRDIKIAHEKAVLELIINYFFKLRLNTKPRILSVNVLFPSCHFDENAVNCTS